MARAGTSLDVISFNDITLESARNISGVLTTYMSEIKHLELRVKHRNVMAHFARRNWDHENQIESLKLNGAKDVSSPGYNYRLTETSITAGLPGNPRTLHTLELTDVGYETFDSWCLNSAPRIVQPPVIQSFPALRRLTITDCCFKNVYAKSEPDTTGEPGISYQADVLHTTLRGALSLEHLKILVPFYSRRPMVNGLENRITITSLQHAVLPPSSVWRIDILTPNLESLAYRLSKIYMMQSKRLNERRPLIPHLTDSPLAVDSLTRLKSLEFVCCREDDSARLQDWISRLPNLAELVIRDVEKSPYPPFGGAENPENRTANQALRMLNDNPDWCPALSTLCFESCFTPGKRLVEFVRTRKQSPEYATINKLTLRGCTKLSLKVKRVLAREVTQFEVQVEYKSNTAGAMMKKFMDDDFEDVVGEVCKSPAALRQPPF